MGMSGFSYCGSVVNRIATFCQRAQVYAGPPRQISSSLHRRMSWLNTSHPPGWMLASSITARLVFYPVLYVATKLATQPPTCLASWSISGDFYFCASHPDFCLLRHEIWYSGNSCVCGGKLCRYFSQSIRSYSQLIVLNLDRWKGRLWVALLSLKKQTTR